MTAGRTSPCLLYHFTHVDHLESIIRNGLVGDTAAQSAGVIRHEAGNRGIKDDRRRARVPLPPGGVVADFVPFYFAPRSPMLFAIARGNVPEYGEGQDPLVYLVSSVELLLEHGHHLLFTRRNAVLATAEFTDDPDSLPTHVDWPLMQARYWADTIEDGDRRARRMAECLVRGPLRATDFIGIGVRTAGMVGRVGEVLTTLDCVLPVRHRPDWYFE